MRAFLIAMLMLAACDRDRAEPSPDAGATDAAILTPSGPPPGCLPGWHVEGATCVLDVDAGVEAR